MGMRSRWEAFRESVGVGESATDKSVILHGPSKRVRPEATDDRIDQSAIPADIPPEQVYHDAALTTLTAQLSSNDVLDGRVSNSLTVGSTALPVTFTLLNLTRDPGESLSLGTADTIFICLALVFYVGIIVINGAVSRLNNQGIKYGPDLTTLKHHVPAYVAQPYGGRALKNWVANEYLASTGKNDEFLQRKARYVYRAQLCQHIEVAILTFWAAWTLLT